MWNSLVQAELFELLIIEDSKKTEASESAFVDATNKQTRTQGYAFHFEVIKNCILFKIAERRILP